MTTLKQALESVIQNQSLTEHEWLTITGAWYEDNGVLYPKTLAEVWSNSNLPTEAKAAAYINFIMTLPPSDDNDTFSRIQLDQIACLSHVLRRHSIVLGSAFADEVRHYINEEEHDHISYIIKSYLMASIHEHIALDRNYLAYVLDCAESEWFTVMDDDSYTFAQISYAYMLTQATKALTLAIHNNKDDVDAQDLEDIRNICAQYRDILDYETAFTDWYLELSHYMYHKDNFFNLKRVYTLYKEHQHIFNEDLSFVNVVIPIVTQRLDF